MATKKTETPKARKLNKLVSDRLKELDWTPYKLAQEVGSNKQTIYNFLDGTSGINSDTLETILEALGLGVVVK